MFSLRKFCFLCFSDKNNKKHRNILLKDSDGVKIEEKLKHFLAELIEFKPDIPKYICNNCLQRVKNIYNFRLKCLKTLKSLNKHLEKLETGNNIYKKLTVTLQEIQYERNKRKLTESTSIEKGNSIEFEPQNKKIRLENLEIKLENDESQTNCEKKLEKPVNDLYLENLKVESIYPDNFCEIIIEESKSELSIQNDCGDVTSNILNDSKILKEENETILLFQNEELEIKKPFKKRKINNSPEINLLDNEVNLLDNEINQPDNEQMKLECENCKKKFTELTLKTHICNKITENIQKNTNQLNNEPNQLNNEIIHSDFCVYCSQTFTNSFLFINHFKEKHFDSLFPCQKCQKKFSNYTKYKRHLFCHENELKCEKCDFVSLYEHTLKLHQAEHEKKVFKCEICKKTFSEHLLLKKHVNRVHKKLKKVTLKCDSCEIKFKNNLSLKEHLMLTHNLNYNELILNKNGTYTRLKTVHNFGQNITNEIESYLETADKVQENEKCVKNKKNIKKVVRNNKKCKKSKQTNKKIRKPTTKHSKNRGKNFQQLGTLTTDSSNQLEVGNIVETSQQSYQCTNNKITNETNSISTENQLEVGNIVETSKQSYQSTNNQITSETSLVSTKKLNQLEVGNLSMPILEVETSQQSYQATNDKISSETNLVSKLNQPEVGYRDMPILDAEISQQSCQSTNNQITNNTDLFKIETNPLEVDNQNMSIKTEKSNQLEVGNQNDSGNKLDKQEIPKMNQEPNQTEIKNENTELVDLPTEIENIKIPESNKELYTLKVGDQNIPVMNIVAIETSEEPTEICNEKIPKASFSEELYQLNVGDKNIPVMNIPAVELPDLPTEEICQQTSQSNNENIPKSDKRGCQLTTCNQNIPEAINDTQIVSQEYQLSIEEEKIPKSKIKTEEDFEQLPTNEPYQLKVGDKNIPVMNIPATKSSDVPTKEICQQSSQPNNENIPKSDGRSCQLTTSKQNIPKTMNDKPTAEKIINQKCQLSSKEEKIPKSNIITTEEAFEQFYQISIYNPLENTTEILNVGKNVPKQSYQPEKVTQAINNNKDMLINKQTNQQLIITTSQSYQPNISPQIIIQSPMVLISNIPPTEAKRNVPILPKPIQKDSLQSEKPKNCDQNVPKEKVIRDISPAKLKFISMTNEMDIQAYQSAISQKKDPKYVKITLPICNKPKTNQNVPIKLIGSNNEKQQVGKPKVDNKNVPTSEKTIECADKQNISSQKVCQPKICTKNVPILPKTSEVTSKQNMSNQQGYQSKICTKNIPMLQKTIELTSKQDISCQQAYQSKISTKNVPMIQEKIESIDKKNKSCQQGYLTYKNNKIISALQKTIESASKQDITCQQADQSNKSIPRLQKTIESTSKQEISSKQAYQSDKNILLVQKTIESSTKQDISCKQAYQSNKNIPILQKTIESSSKQDISCKQAYQSNKNIPVLQKTIESSSKQEISCKQAYQSNKNIPMLQKTIESSSKQNISCQQAYQCNKNIPKLQETIDLTSKQDISCQQVYQHKKCNQIVPTSQKILDIPVKMSCPCCKDKTAEKYKIELKKSTESSDQPKISNRIVPILPKNTTGPLKEFFQCNFCPKQFQELDLLKSHFNEHSAPKSLASTSCSQVENQYACPYCPEKFPTSNKMLVHRKYIHGFKYILPK